MQVQQVNGYSNYSNNNPKQLVRESLYISKRNNNSANVSFQGLNLGKNLKKMVTGTIEGARELISRTRRTVESSFSDSLGRVQEANVSFNEVRHTPRVAPGETVTVEQLKESQERLNRKRMEIVNMGYAVENLQMTASTNRALADALPAQLAELEPAKELERHRLIKMQNPDIPQFGFEKIAGYQGEKDLLQRLFFKSIDLEKQGKSSSVPGFFLFFGPTGNGKTAISRAVAEETGCLLVPVSSGITISNKSRTTFMQMIRENAAKAEELFRKKATRTILFVDELTRVVSKDSNILDEFNQFAAECSAKYHCTIFGATNHMSELGLDLKRIDPVIMSIDPPTRENTRALFKHYMQGITPVGKIDFDVLTDSLIATGQQRGGIYSNSQIKEIVRNTADASKSGISQADLLACIEYGNPARRYEKPIPTIDREKKAIFDKDYKTYILGQ